MGLEFWSNVATVWLSFLCFIGLCVAVVASIYMVKGMHTVVDRTPRALRQVQGYSRLMRTQVNAASNRVVEPVIQAHVRTNQFTMLVGRILRTPTGRKRGDREK